MKFSDFICFKAIIPELKAKDRDEAIVELVNALVKAGKLKSSQSAEIIKSVIKREKEQGQHGMGKGLRCPTLNIRRLKRRLPRSAEAAEAWIFLRWTTACVFGDTSDKSRK